ncbi:hypothetical protein ACB371_05225 [Klebsiella pneumoniae]
MFLAGTGGGIYDARNGTTACAATSRYTAATLAISPTAATACRNSISSA